MNHLDHLKKIAFDGNSHIEKVWMTKAFAQDLYAYCVGLQARQPFDLEAHIGQVEDRGDVRKEFARRAVQ